MVLAWRGEAFGRSVGNKLLFEELAGQATQLEPCAQLACLALACECQPLVLTAC